MPDQLDLHQTGLKECVRILHVDDNSAIAAAVAHFLTGKGYEVETATSGAEALARVLEWPEAYDLIITDYSMPEITGLQWIKALRGTGYPGKIFVFTTSLPKGVEEQFHALGVHRILHKSSSFESLHLTVEELLSESDSTGSEVAP